MSLFGRIHLKLFEDRGPYDLVWVSPEVAGPDVY